MTTHAMKAKHHTAQAGRMPLPRCPCHRLQLSRMSTTATVGTGLPGNTVGPPASTHHPYHKPHGLGQAKQPGTDGCSIHFCPSLSSSLGKAAHFIGVCFSCQSLAKNLSAPAALPVPRIVLLPSSSASPQLKAHTHRLCGVPVHTAGRERCPSPLPKHGNTEPPATTIVSA